MPKTNLPTETDQDILITEILKSNMPAPLNLQGCMFDQVYTAGCYANLSYFLSQLHPHNVDSIAHVDTRKLVENHQNIAVDIYDDLHNPKAGAIVIPLETETIIAFHGINFSNKSNHVNNFDSHLIHSPFAPGLYHAGFMNISHAIIPKIIHVLESKVGLLSTYNHKIRIYGHSMGAGLAQLLTQYLQHQYENLDIETIVFGSPKVMCPIAATVYNEKNSNRTLRVENPLDLAIYMPAQFMGYGVVNTVVLLPKLHSDIVKNHKIEGYLEAIDTLRQQFRSQGIESVSLTDYLAASAKFNPIHPWMPTLGETASKTLISEFLQIMGHGISKGVQSLIRWLPFK
jgi:hypothetical protein